MLRSATEAPPEDESSVSLPETGTPSLQRLFLTRPFDWVKPGQGLFWEGEPSTSVFQVVSGVIRAFRHTADGRRGITGFLFPGDSFAFCFSDTCLYSAEAVTLSRVRRFPRQRLQLLLAESPQLQRPVFSAISQEASGAQDHLLTLSQMSAEERVAYLLLLIARKSGSPRGSHVAIDVPMSRADMADFLGLTMETVCRAITTLKRENYITLIGPRTMLLKRPGDLSALAGSVRLEAAE